MERKGTMETLGNPERVPLISKIAYGFGDVGCNFSWMFVSNFLMIFFTDVFGISMAAVSGRRTNNKGRAASIFALLTGCSMLLLYLFSVKEQPAAFYFFSGLTQFFFSGFNTAIYAIIPDCAEYGQWKTGLRNDGFQYAFISLGNKVGMALGTALLAGMLGKFGYVANRAQNEAVVSVMKHVFTTVPGVLWIVTAAVLFFYRLNKTRYNEIVEELKQKEGAVGN